MKRILSIDVFRGFDMLFIMGFSIFVTKFCIACGWGAECWLARQMHHVEWDGLHVYDLVYPTFLFIAGMSFPFSARAGQQGAVVELVRLRRGRLFAGRVCRLPLDHRREGRTGWTFFFKVIGVNAIVVYMLGPMFYFEPGGLGNVTRFFLGALCSHVPEAIGEAIFQLGYVLVNWLVLLFLYRKNVFLKV